jgi:hypothetical protein
MLKAHSFVRTSRSVCHTVFLDQFSLVIECSGAPKLTPILGPSCATESPGKGLCSTASLSGALVATCSSVMSRKCSRLIDACWMHSRAGDETSLEIEISSLLSGSGKRTAVQTLSEFGRYFHSYLQCFLKF